ncbi:MAG: LysR family transcriptional regulator [Pseudomonadota bacterium]
MEDWDQYRFFLAVARVGSLSGAARELGVSQPTVSRRITQLERRLEATLFTQTQGGVSLTDVGRDLLDSAEAIAAAATDLKHKVDLHEREPTGTVSLSAPGALMDGWLPEKLKEFRDEYPHILVECLPSDRPADLAHGECDVAVQYGRPAPTFAIGSRISEVGFGIFASREYLFKHGIPKSEEDLAGHQYIAASGHLGCHQPIAEFNELMKRGNPAFRTNCSQTYVKLARKGNGLVCISELCAVGAPDLVRVLPGIFSKRVEFWMLSHPALRKSVRVRALLDHIRGCAVSHARAARAC